MNGAKIQLSAEELALVQRGDWILTKNAVIAKQYEMYGTLSEKMKPLLESLALPDAALEAGPKISRGEALEGLPYVVLDYPRHYSRTSVFAIRNLFWWAHYFSTTLHLKAVYKEQFTESVIANREMLGKAGFRIHNSENEWDHGQHDAHSFPLGSLDDSKLRDIIIHHPFLKITARFGLDEWNQAERLLLDAFRSLTAIFT